MAVREADVVVVGAGSVGSMATWQLARRGRKVIAVDRFPIPGPFSSYAGESRLFRKVYAEGGHYAPMLQRSQELWHELEALSGVDLLHTVGAVTILDAENPRVEALQASGQGNGLVYEMLRGRAAQARYPEHRIRDTDVALFDPEGGYLSSERAVVAAVAEAMRLGAEFLGGRAAQRVERSGERYVVTTDQEEIIADRVIIAQGNGAREVCRQLGVHLSVLPQVLTWFPAKDPAALLREGMPVFVRGAQETGREEHARFYGFPSSDGWTMKVVGSVYMDDVDSMMRPPTWDPEHIDPIRRWVAEFMPGLIPEPVRVATCADGYLPDETALLGEVPGMAGVTVAVGLSGHGFKMATGYGAVLADLAIDGTTATDIGFMEPTRFLDADVRFEGLALS